MEVVCTEEIKKHMMKEINEYSEDKPNENDIKKMGNATNIKAVMKDMNRVSGLVTQGNPGAEIKRLK